MTDAREPAEKSVAVNYEYSPHLPELLAGLNLSVLVSTYQAGKLFVLGTAGGQLVPAFFNFEQAMGVAVRPDRIAVGTRRQVWMLQSTPDLAGRIDPPGRYDGCFLTRSALFTGAIQGHELAWAGDTLWAVNTLFSSLCTLHPDYSFVPQWRPPFVTALAAEDRCHLNGMAFADGRPRYVTALAETDVPAGWRPTKAVSGVVLEVPSGRAVVRGLSMPHSPRLHGGALWVLNSGRGQLLQIDPATGQSRVISESNGYTRGLAFAGPYALIGLSKIRETNVFGGLPIAERRDQLNCGLVVIDLRNGREVAGLVFHSGVSEVFDVQILPGVRCPAISGPLPDADGAQTIWLAPDPAAARPLSGMN